MTLKDTNFQFIRIPKARIIKVNVIRNQSFSPEISYYTDHTVAIKMSALVGMAILKVTKAQTRLTSFL